MSRCVKSSRELDLSSAYRVEYEEYISDYASAGIVMTHKKSGARVCVLSNNDDNKCFMIGFRTTPSDDTGVPHIIEHTVLCGSDKFPVKDPFLELMKGSLNTFLNAMTYPDKTCYPVCSCNDADFANLMDIYMDAVLHPNIYKFEEIFKQEGWHYELTAPDEPVTINGIVYSEMKGALASPDSKISRDVLHALFPDTTYGVESGGDPEAIPDLTYEQFLDFHRRYYHPSNSYIVLYGNMDVEERLAWLDEEYLCKYDVQQVDSEVGFQEPRGTMEVTAYYPVGADDPVEGASYLSWGYLLADRKDVLKIAGLEILVDVLFNSPGAPLRDALIKAGVGQDIEAATDDEVLQPYGMVTIQNTEPSKMNDFRRILREQLQKLVKEGINRNSLLAAVNKAEFSYCEADFGRTPKSLVYSLNIVGAWLYDDAGAFDATHMRDIYEVLRDKIDTGFYEELISEFMLNSRSEVFYTLIPDREIAGRADAALKSRLADFKASLTEEGISALIRDTAALKAYQAEPSTDEQLRTVPQLSREDIGRESAPVIAEQLETSGIQTIYHDIETNGIVYLRLMFNMDKVPEDLLPYAGLVSKLYGVMDTHDHSYLELDNEVNIHTGGISTDVIAYGIKDTDDAYIPLFTADGRAMEHEFDRMLELMGEELLDTELTSVGRFRELLAESKARQQSYFNNSGVRVAISRARACVSSLSRFIDQATGLELYGLVCKLLESSDDELKAALEKCAEVSRMMLGKDNLTLDVTCSRELFDRISDRIGSLTGKFRMVRKGDVAGSRYGISFERKALKEAFKVPGEVCYLSLAGGYKIESEEDEGLLNLAAQIVASDYLWNNIRVLGGAYGGGFSTFSVSKVGVFHSYRDPHLNRTHEVYKKTVDYLRSFTADERQMTKYIIGTIGTLDTPLTPYGKATRSLNCVMSGVTYEDINRRRIAILEATQEDVRRMAGYIEQILAGDNYCCVGGERKITEYADKFKTIRNLN